MLDTGSLIEGITITEIFLGLFWGLISTPSQSKIEQKLPKLVNNIHNSLALQFGVNFMIIRKKKNSKVIDVYIHTLVHNFVVIIKFNAITLIIYYGFKTDNLKLSSSFFRQNLVFPILVAQMTFSQIQQALGPDIRKVGKSLYTANNQTSLQFQVFSVYLCLKKIGTF